MKLGVVRFQVAEVSEHSNSAVWVEEEVAGESVCGRVASDIDTRGEEQDGGTFRKGFLDGLSVQSSGVG